jgi:hypothetical protein
LLYGISKFSEIAFVLVRLNHVACRVINADHSVPWASFVGRFGDQKITASHTPQL